MPNQELDLSSLVQPGNEWYLHILTTLVSKHERHINGHC